MKLLDYGNREQTIILPENDAFSKLNKSFETEGQLKGI